MNYYQEYKKYKNIYYGGNDDKLKIFDKLFNKLKDIIPISENRGISQNR